MANTFREVYKKTGTSSYQLVGNVGVGGVKLDVMKGASTSATGEIGLVPKPSTGKSNRYLSSDGTWKTLTYNNVPNSSTTLSYNKHTKVNEMVIEKPGLYIIFFRARITRVEGANVGNSLGINLIQLQLHSEGSNEVNYVVTHPNFITQDNSFNEYDIARITTPNTKVYMTVYHNSLNYTITNNYSSISAVLLED